MISKKFKVIFNSFYSFAGWCLINCLFMLKKKGPTYYQTYKYYEM